MKALFITKSKILPMNDGAFIYTYGILQYLKKYNMEIDFVSFYETEPYSELEKIFLLKLCNNVECVKLVWQSTALNLSIKYPNNIRKYTRNNMMKILKQKAMDNYDVVIIDHLQVYEYAKLFPNSKIILIEHNAESKIWENYSKKCAGIVRLLVERNAKMTKKYEANAVANADGVISIAETDAEYLSSISNRNDIAIMHPYNLYDIIKTDSDIENVDNSVLFIGSYGWYPNQEAARFLAKEVMPLLRKKFSGIKLYLVGKSPTDEIIGYGNENEDIVVTGMVDSVDPYIKKCDLFINAMFDGSGMNIKMMEAMGKGIPIITSTFGARGINLIDGEEALIFDTVDSCVECVSEILVDRGKAKQMAGKARKFYEVFIEPGNRVKEVFFE